MKNVISLINKKVKTSNPGIVHFFYPAFTFVDEKNESVNTSSLQSVISKNNVIFKGNNPNYVNKIKNKKSKNDIIHVVENNSTNIDVDLDNKSIMLQFIYNKHNKSYKREKKAIKDIIKQLEGDNYYEFVKLFWVIGDAKFCLNYDKNIEDKINNILEYTLTKPDKVMKALNEFLSQDVTSRYYYILENKITNLFIDATQGKQYYNEYLIKSIKDYDNKLNKFRKRYPKDKIVEIITEYRNNVDNLKENDIRLALLDLFTLLLT